MKQFSILVYLLISVLVSIGQTADNTKQSKEHREQHPSDTKLAEYVTGLTDSKIDVSVLVVGFKLESTTIDTLDLKTEFAELDKKLTHVIVFSDEVAAAMKSKTTLPIIVAEDLPSEKSAIGRMKWTIVDAKGSDLGRVRGSAKLERILKPRSERDKPRE